MRVSNFSRIEATTSPPMTPMPAISKPIAAIWAQVGSTSGFGSGVGWPKSSVWAHGSR